MRLKRVIERQREGQKSTEKRRAEAKIAVKSWMDQFEKDNGRAPAATDKEKVKHLFHEHAKVYLCISVIFVSRN
jgi:hypothetical protein